MGLLLGNTEYDEEGRMISRIWRTIPQVRNDRRKVRSVSTSDLGYWHPHAAPPSARCRVIEILQTSLTLVLRARLRARPERAPLAWLQPTPDTAGTAASASTP